jgi:regulator of cell morphogenesis and NO signaling
VRDLALDIPGATRVFEKMGIDYCCGGGASLDEACTAAGIEQEDVLRALEDASRKQTGSSDLKIWQNTPLDIFADYIVEKHHVFTKNEITRLELLLAKVCAAHAERHPELLELRKLFKQLAEELLVHMMKEERVLFPYVKQIQTAHASAGQLGTPPFQTVKNPIRMMMQEHDAAGEMLTQMRRITSNYNVPSDGCISYATLSGALLEFEEDLHQHIFLENSILFPRAIELEAALRKV